MPAPIVVFAYKRFTHLERTLASLSANTLAGQTELYVYCDAARDPRDEADVEAVRSLAASTRGFASVTVVRRPTNYGLARSIVEGAGEVLARHGRIIVVEDDLVCSPHFLQYMNDGLDRYADDERVASIHGYSYPVDEVLPETFFLRGADCWGWATWSRGWSHYEPDGKVLLEQLRARKLTHAFDLGGNFPFTRMLESQIAGRNDSWAIRWHAACFLKGLLTLYPGRSLVENIGSDASGTHCAATDGYSALVSTEPVRVGRIDVEESTLAHDAFGRFLSRQVGVKVRAAAAVRRVLRLA